MRRNPVYHDPPLCERTDEAGTGGTVIAFTEKTAEALARIEASLGRENPAASVKEMEAKISAQLKWAGAPAAISAGELEDLLRRIEEAVRRSPDGAR